MGSNASHAPPRIDDIVARVAAEAAVRRAAAAQKPAQRVSWADLGARLQDSGAASQFLQRVQGAVFAPNPARAYDIAEFLRLDGLQFIDACYTGLLGRAPDNGGRHHFLSTLLSGMRKAEVMARIRFSAEGRAHGAKVHGLYLHTLAVALFRVPVAGYAAEWLISIISLPKALRGLRAQKAHDALMRQRLIAEIESALRRVESAGRPRR